ncbi:DUF3352 domain-containing protein [Plectonema cf. radiosum LEGE 06105]|uniref:DUF3352 domain-containing protein n=1 Tax=Plectonema cf. radiosum LEGE 06105 TaxID=945769 RepID=A0A8J7FBJ7_9CYAN|nr:DUF3352 domain-containing protein [Plectonema radiosum]MBE9211226.1 DUF3352 domain-containing protein [Plectonema cf. radiosum LEGE 06105]
MKSLFRVGAFATFNLLCCSSIVQAVDVGNNINNLSNKTYAQKITPNSLKIQLQPTATNTQFANFLPNNTPLVAMVDTSSVTWKKAGNFQLFQTAWNGISFLIPPQLKNGYATDIEPWLGEQVAFAFLPKDGSSGVTMESNFVTLAPVKDEQGLQPFLSKLKANQNFTQRQYKGITILETKTNNSSTQPSLPSTENNSIPPVPKSPINKAIKPNVIKNPNLRKQNSLVIGILPGHLAVGSSTKAIERLINTSQQKAATLAQNAQFQKTIRQPQTDKPLFAMYQEPVGYIALVKELIKDPSLGLPQFDLDSLISSEQLQQYQSIGSFLILQKEGVRFQVNTYPSSTFNQNNLNSNIQTQRILSRMPAATYTAVNGEKLNQRWQTIANILSSQKEFEANLKMFRGFISSNTGLDFDRDIINWMDGEFAFFMFPTKGGFFKTINPNLNMGIGLAVETSNRTAAETTLKKLGDLIISVSKGEVKITETNIKNQPITSWDIDGDSAKSLLAYSWVDNNTLIVTTGYGAIADLVPEPYVALPSTYNFKSATDSLPNPNAGYFYMNMGSLLSWIYGFVPPQYSNNQYFNMFKQAIGSVYSVSATSSFNVEREQLDLLIVLAPVRSRI